MYQSQDSIKPAKVSTAVHLEKSTRRFLEMILLVVSWVISRPDVGRRGLWDEQ
jgi:hypothetical protein